MPKRRMRKRKGHTQPKHAHKNQSSTQINQQNLIAIKNQTIIVYDAGDKKVNGVYEHKRLGGDYFEKVGSIQSYKHSNTTGSNTNDDTAGKFEIDRHEYLKNPQDIPDSSLNKSGVWIISRVDVFPKQKLYAGNCPFKSKIKTNGWIVLKDGTSPAPKIKLFATNQESDAYTPKKKKHKKDADNIHDAIKEIRHKHHDDSGNKLNNMQLKAMKKRGNISKKNDKMRIVCGGQTGVDRAALDVALEMNVPYSGWIPKGRKAEDGVIDADKYGDLKECESSEYSVRTLLNVVDSDATLILNMGRLEGGTLGTKKYVSQKNKDLMYITLFVNEKSESDVNEEKKMDDEDYISNLGFADGRAQRVSEWIRCTNIKVLNIAGPRESERKGIYDESVTFLRKVFHHFKNGDIPRKSLFN